MHWRNPRNWSKTSWTVVFFVASMVLFRLIQVDFVEVGQKIRSAAADPRWDVLTWGIALALLKLGDKRYTIQKIQEVGLRRINNPEPNTSYYVASGFIVMIIMFLYGLTTVEFLGRFGSAGWSVYQNPTLMGGWALMSTATGYCIMVALHYVAVWYFFVGLPEWIDKINYLEAYEPEKVKRWLSEGVEVCQIGLLVYGFILFIFK